MLRACDTGGTVNWQSECTLRAAIQQANAQPDKQVIVFGVPGVSVPTIRPASKLSEIIHQPRPSD